MYKVKSKNPVCNKIIFVNESEMNPVSAKHEDRNFMPAEPSYMKILKQVLQTKSK